MTLVNELLAGGNKFLYENFHILRAASAAWQKRYGAGKMNDKVRLAQAVGAVRNRDEIGLHEGAARSLVLHA
ncbi:MAG: hypothetical protein DMF24_07550 [Verrucomicrobia bacterium]|nr:MAG: hypothetical protein DMF24_07550 [Verrucomicrobiota bacterium]